MEIRKLLFYLLKSRWEDRKSYQAFQQGEFNMRNWFKGCWRVARAKMEQGSYLQEASMEIERAKGRFSAIRV